MPSRGVKETEKAFKRFLHPLFRLFFRRGDPSRYPVQAEKVRTILILRPDKLGDMMTIIPAAHALKREFPRLRIEILASPLNKQLVENDPVFDTVHIYRKNILDDLPLVRRLRAKRFDIIFDAICLDSVTGLLLTRLIGNSSITAASRKQGLLRYYDYCEPYQRDGQEHNIDNGLLIFNLFGLNPATIDPFSPVHIPEESQAKAATFVKSIGVSGKFCVGLNISAGSPTRTLEISKYAAVLDGIARDLPTARFIVICTKEDRERGRQLLQGREGKAFLVPEGLSLLDATAVISHVDMFISPDTSLIHIARLMKIPVVGLYCGHMRNYHSWKPYRQQHGSVVSTHEGHLHDIEAQQVVDEFRKVMASVGSKDAETSSSTL